MSTTVQLGFLVGSIPTACMIAVSLLFYRLEISPHVEAGFQNFAAGSVLAAVASELFPLLHEV